MATLALQDVYKDILETVRSTVTDTTLSDEFLRMVSEYLAQDAEITDPTFGFWDDKISGKNYEIAGCAWDDERKLLTFIGCEFFNDDEIQTVTKDLYTRKFKALINFMKLATDTKNPLWAQMTVTDPASEVARIVFDNYASARNIEFILITNGQRPKTLSKADAKITMPGMDESKFSFKMFDITRIYQLRTSETSFEDLEIDFCDKTPDRKGLKCLPAICENCADYRSYLAIMPAETLAMIYDEFGQKLLEQNVRTFLQLKSKPNKGMSITIDQAPERFFAYNNGLTCTAAEPEFEVDGDVLYLKSAKGFQIVNGGQTTNVIYGAYKAKKDLSNVSVQMKLSVVEDREMYSDFVEKVARYANTQNPVKESDFFSNSEFHKRFKEISQTLWAPALNGKQNKTKWYYERTRGQYLAEYAGKGERAKNEFLAIYPKEQMIDKIILAKTEAIFCDGPHIANKQQKAFTHFVDTIEKKLDKDNNSINENYFKEAIAKVLLAKKTDSIIAKSDWYQANKSVKSEFKAYALGLLNSYVTNKNKFIDFGQIWNLQDVPETFVKIIEKSILKVREYMLREYPDLADWREKFKLKYVWTEVSKLDLELSDDELEDITVSEQVQKTVARAAKKEAKQNTAMNAVVFCVEKPKQHWGILLDFFANHPGMLQYTDYGVLQSMVYGKISVPSDKQAQILQKIYCLAQQHDVKFS